MYVSLYHTHGGRSSRSRTRGTARLSFLLDPGLVLALAVRIVTARRRELSYASILVFVVQGLLTRHVLRLTGIAGDAIRTDVERGAAG